MIDLPAFSAFLDAKPTVVITTEDMIDEFLIDFFATNTQWSVSKLSPLFGVPSKRVFYPCCVICACGKSVRAVNKTQFFALVYNRRGDNSHDSDLPICPDCIEEKRAASQRSTDERERREQEHREQSLPKFADIYLNPAMAFKPEFPRAKWFSSLQQQLWYVDREELAEYIKSLEYKDFLKTPYWKAVAQQVRYRAKYRCQLCNETGETHVHHRDYSIHGYEHDHLNDLICLCAPCHKTHHFPV